MISLLAAMGQRQIIGSDNGMPWHLPNDLQFFKQKTTGHAIVMGRKTFDSIGKALPKRQNYVVTSQSEHNFPEEVSILRDLEMVKTWNEKHPDEELFVIGGSRIFEQVMDIADRMYITYIDHAFEGDTNFPIFTMDDWSLTSKVDGEKNDKNPYDYYFFQYDRR